MKKTAITIAVLVLLLSAAGSPARAQGWEEDILRSAMTAHLAKRYDEAVKGYVRALEINPANPVTYYNLACCMALTGKEKEALTFLAASWVLGYRDLDHIQADPDFDRIRKRPAFVALMKRLEQAREEDGLTEMQLIGRGFMEYERKRYPEAKRWFIAALRRNPGNPGTLYNLACCLSLMKDEDLALKCLATAWVAGFRDLDHIRRDPDFVPIRHTTAFRNLLRNFEADLVRSRVAQAQRMRQYMAYVQALQAQQHRQVRANTGRSGGSSGGGSSTWRSNVTDTGISSDGDFIGIVGRGWSVCTGN